MLVPNRHDSLEDYRYGFQGQEKDDEIKGEGNSYDYDERMLDPRIGRWFKIDPQASQMPQVSPYAFALNNPILIVDEEGEIPIIPFLIKAGASAAADALLQACMIYLTDDSVKDFGSAFKKIDKSDVAWSFVEGLNPFKVPGGKLGKAAAVATADLLIYVGEQTLAGEDISSQDLGKEFMVGFFSELAGDKAGELLSNKKVRAKVGALIGEKELNKLVEKIVPKADEGVIYRVAGDKTPSGKPYIGSADDLDIRNKNAADGRDRSEADIIGTYKKGDKVDRKRSEQTGMDEEFKRQKGKPNQKIKEVLDNKRNEVAKKNRSKYGL
jgi:RHS repeat-associated protein